jgi:hypothetical protein
MFKGVFPTPSCIYTIACMLSQNDSSCAMLYHLTVRCIFNVIDVGLSFQFTKQDQTQPELLVLMEHAELKLYCLKYLPR